MARKCSVVLSGVGGYGTMATDALLKREDADIVGFIDPYPENYHNYTLLKEKSVRYDSLEQFYATGIHTDLCVINSPIQYHSGQSILAMENGSHVLCEKPAAATPQDIRAMAAQSARCGLYCDIGYQWSHSDAILKLKDIILSGRLGKAKRLRSRVFWPRNKAYYSRAAWPGKVRDAQGRFILDSIASNATAHYLHNMFFLLGTSQRESACPVHIQTELYRAYPVETFDTVMCRATTINGTEILFYASHAVKENEAAPRFVFEFENGRVVYPRTSDDLSIDVIFNDGTTQNVGSPGANDLRKLEWMLSASTDTKSPPPPCPAEAALPLTLSVCAMHKAVSVANSFPKELLRTREDYVYVEGLQELLVDCFEKGVLPSETGIEWAKAAIGVDITPDDVFADPGIR